jgi:hypothetical protein
MPRALLDPRRAPAHWLRTLHYAPVAPGWPDVVVCELPVDWLIAGESRLAIFCETDPELIATMEAITFGVAMDNSASMAANRLRALCNSPSGLTDDGVAIYAPTVFGAPWLYVEAVSDSTHAFAIRGRYSWRTFVGSFEALAHMDERHEVLSARPLEAAAYRLPSRILPTLPSFMPGPWE